MEILKGKQKEDSMVIVTQGGKEVKDMSQIKIPEETVKIIKEGLKN